MAMWLRHPKEESHMAQLLNAMQAKYSNYSKLAAGKFHDLFHGQFFFDFFDKLVARSAFGRGDSRTHGPLAQICLDPQASSPNLPGSMHQENVEHMICLDKYDQKT